MIQKEDFNDQQEMDRQEESTELTNEQLPKTFQEEEEPQPDELDETSPIIPVTVYSNLPELLSECVMPFSDQREKDVILTSAITILSGCFENMSGIYRSQIVYPNLYAFIVAPPSSGKGVMPYSRQLGEAIHRAYSQTKRLADEEYRSKLEEWNRLSKKKGTEPTEKPEKKKYPLLFLPGNSSAAAIYQQLDNNNGTGIICESEADTLNVAMKQDWGNFSDLLRKAWHHEAISLARAGNILLEVPFPRLSVLLSGTNNQVPKLIETAEDGLFSRFLFYSFQSPMQWRSISGSANVVDLRGYFEQIGSKTLMLKKKLDSMPAKFSLTKEQMDSLDVFFSELTNKTAAFEGEGARSIVFRLGLICFRIAMILTILREEDQLGQVASITCRDQDFSTALSLIEVYYLHAIEMYRSLPKSEPKTKIKEFLEQLPVNIEFKRKEATEIGKILRLSPRTVGNYLSLLVNTNHLIKSSYGTYLKKI